MHALYLKHTCALFQDQALYLKPKRNYLKLNAKVEPCLVLDLNIKYKGILQLAPEISRSAPHPK